MNHLDFVLHRAADSVLAVRMSDGAVYQQLYLPGLDTAQLFGDDKNGWEWPLAVHEAGLRRTGLPEWRGEWTTRAHVLCAIMEAVQDLPEDHVARCAIIGSTITEVAEDTLANLVPESRRPTGSFPVFEALQLVLQAIDICEVHQ